jgi:argininosuccinate lyase
MSLADYKQLSPLFDEDIQEAIRPETCVRNRDSFGGTSYHQSELQLKAGKALMEKEKAILDEKMKLQDVL